MATDGTHRENVGEGPGHVERHVELASGEEEHHGRDARPEHFLHRGRVRAVPGPHAQAQHEPNEGLRDQLGLDAVGEAPPLADEDGGQGVDRDHEGTQERARHNPGELVVVVGTQVGRVVQDVVRRLRQRRQDNASANTPSE